MFTMGPPFRSQPSGGDPFLAFVQLQMRFEGANNGTVFTNDVGTTSPEGFNGVVTSTDQAKFGLTSAKFPNSSNDSAIDGAVTPEGRAIWAHSVNTSATFECFVYFVSTTGTQHIFEMINDNFTTTFVARLADGSIQARYASTTTTNIGTGLLPLSQWHHIAVVSQAGSNSKLYVNGVLAATLTNGPTSPPSTVVSIKIGNRSAGLQNMRGYIDSARFTFGAARYTSNFTPPTADYQ